MHRHCMGIFLSLFAYSQHTQLLNVSRGYIHIYKHTIQEIYPSVSGQLQTRLKLHGVTNVKSYSVLISVFSDITVTSWWAWWRLKSPALRLFTQPFIQAQIKARVTGLCAGNSPGPVNSPHKGPVIRKMFPFDDVIMERMQQHFIIPESSNRKYHTRSPGHSGNTEFFDAVYIWYRDVITPLVTIYILDIETCIHRIHYNRWYRCTSTIRGQLYSWYWNVYRLLGIL